MEINKSNIEIANTLLHGVCDEYGFDWNEIAPSLQNHLDELIMKHAFVIVERPYENSILAGALLMWKLYCHCPLKLSDYVLEYKKYMRSEVVQFLISNEEALMKAMVFERDFRMGFFASATMIKIYLSRLGYSREPLEIPQFCLMRVAAGLFCKEGIEGVLNIFSRYNKGHGIPASPVIFNIGFSDGAPASCILDTMDDSLEDIYEVLKQSALASKANAGLGIYLGDLRHGEVGRSGMGSGIIPVARLIDISTRYVNQGGRRPGATTITTRICHYDTPEFIRLVDPTGEESSRVDKVYLSIVLCDLFMERVARNEMWSFFCPKQTSELNGLYGKDFTAKYIEYEEMGKRWNRYQEYLKTKNPQLSWEFKGGEPPRIDMRQQPAREVMEAICDMECKAGSPFIIHGCNVNRKNNMCNVGMVKTSNLCQEIMIPAVPKEQTGCCNLSSISIKAFVVNKKYDFLSFGEATRDFVVALNRVVDNTINVSPKVMKSNSENRPIGLGVSGLGDALLMLELPVVDINSLPKRDGKGGWRKVNIAVEAPDYDEEALLRRTLNPEAEEFVWKLWSCMYYNALLSSLEEAKKYGPYLNFHTAPIARGKLQYHLWQDEERETGRKYPFRLYPCEPKEWGQEGSWDWLISQILIHGVRNALILTCMPTVSTSQVLNNSESFELHPHHIYNKRALSGDCPIVNHCIHDLLSSLGLWNASTCSQIMSSFGSILGIPEDGLSVQMKKRLRFIKELGLTQFEVPQKIMITLAAVRQVFICHSQSLNLNIINPTPEKMAKIHQFTWQMGLKTGMYYLRTRSAADALEFKTEQICTKIRDVCISCT